jgi:transmembrane sensor
MTEHTNDIEPTTPVTEQASNWWVLLNEGDATAADHRTFAEWVARSPERVEAYLQAACLGRALRSRRMRWPDTPVEDLIRAARAAQSEVVSFPFAHRARFPRRLGLCVAAAGLVAVAVLMASLYVYSRPLRLETGVGEQRSVLLADGSLVTLNTSSSLEVYMKKDRRILRLLAGEALFRVAHESARPFEVTAGGTTVRAIGTQFDVNRCNSRTTVTVVEGRVAVFAADEGGLGAGAGTKVPLDAGEQLTLAPRTESHPARADVPTALAWTQRKLIFQHRQLGEVAGEFNRYNREIIEIRSDELRAQEVTGVFQADDPGSFLVFLSAIPGVMVQQSADHSRFVVTQETQNVTPPNK